MDWAPFVRYRAQLTALADQAAARLALETAGFWPSGLQWREMFGRFHPGAAPYAVQVFGSSDNGVQRIARVEAFDVPPGALEDGEAWSQAGAIGFLRVTRLTADPSLPAIASILAGDAEAIVIRYHPGLRCTVRSVRDGRAVFGKVFCDDRGRELCEDYERLWLASTRGDLAFAVARPIRWDGEHRTLWQAALPGYAIRTRLRTDEGPGLARRLGAALGSLAQSQVTVRRAFSACDQMARTARHAADLAARVPALAADVEDFMTRLAGSRALTARRVPRPIHGAPIATQWLASGERLGLIDFDRFSAGDPELDVGVFLADLDFERLPIDAARALAVALIDGWQATAGPLDRESIEFYRAHRHLDKALKRACAIRPDGDRRASASLRRSIGLLAPAFS